jgi:hypothetical protein
LRQKYNPKIILVSVTTWKAGLFQFQAKLQKKKLQIFSFVYVSMESTPKQSFWAIFWIFPLENDFRPLPDVKI